MIQIADRFKNAKFIGTIVTMTLAIYCAGCSSNHAASPPEDLEFAQASSAARLAYDQGDEATAAGLYKNALGRACEMDDATAIADSAYNLAVCEIDLSRYDSGLNHLKEARFEQNKKGTSTDEVLLLMAKVAYLQARDSDAESMARHLAAGSSSELRLQAQVLLTLIACDRGNSAQAKSSMAALREMTARDVTHSPSIAADVAKAEGATYRVLGQPHDAAEAFDRETDLLRAAHRYRQIIHSLSRSGDAHQNAGEAELAADRYYRAARACAAIKDERRATDLARRALTEAKRAGDAEIIPMIESLISERGATTAP